MQKKTKKKQEGGKNLFTACISMYSTFIISRKYFIINIFMWHMVLQKSFYYADLVLKINVLFLAMLKTAIHFIIYVMLCL